MLTYLFPFFHRSFSTGTRTVPRSRVAAGGSRRTGARRLRPDSDGSHSAKAGGRVAQGRGHVQKGSYTQATSTTIYNIITVYRFSSSRGICAKDPTFTGDGKYPWENVEMF